ncbi:type VI secretion system protein ImpH [Azospirillum agricola]|uniref:type VI secretion system baseplate subunit TssG n=1 Tax=Azospirillum agricola TaxID=1720247 RepID=UPI001AE2F1C6|nr:type VI secretion system baseplate subunit TssG [Azospirillum agricola]MBP2233049.1 type VI secretion system protein ImpH [Azospirillum agricola]
MIEQLAAEAHRFDALQAIGLIERMLPDARSVGEGADSRHEAVRFRSSLATAFPASDLAAATPPGPGEPRWELLVNFLGLAGGFGPLPAPFTEAIVQRVRAGDTATRDFLDILNHRLVSLLYRARRLHRPALNRGTPDQGPMAQHLYSLIGLGTPGLRGRMAVPDRVLLDHAGVLAQQPRTLHGLERLLGDHFGVPVRAVPLQGRWLALDDTQVTRLGRLNSALGDGTVLGRRVWDQQAAVTLELGPLGLEAFRAFLPGGHAARALRDLARFYLGPGTDVSLRLRLAPERVPASRLVGANRLHLHSPRVLAERPRAAGVRLGAEDGRLLTRAGPNAPRLGWTSWLVTRRRTTEGIVQPMDGQGGTHG